MFPVRAGVILRDEPGFNRKYLSSTLNDDIISAGGLLEDILLNPKKLGEHTPKEWYDILQKEGYNPMPLGVGNYKGIGFDKGGGYRVLWDGDKSLLYHPADRSRHDGAYYKLSSGNTGIIRYNLDGTPKREVRSDE